MAKANCVTTCPYYDWQGQLYGQKDPSYETVVSSRGGSGNTRFYGSINDRLNKGIHITTGARRTDGRLNLDQTIGEKLTVSGGLDVTHSFAQNGIGGNDNSGTSPVYAFGYAPAIYDIQQRVGPGRFVKMFMNGGGTAASNPFDLLENMTNNEDTWRQTGNIRVGYSAYTSAKNTLQLSYIGGVDRFQFEGNQYTPGFLQFEPADGFLGTSQILTTTSRFINQSVLRNFSSILHGEQGLILHGKLPTEGGIIGKTRITGIVDRGEGKGALMYSEFIEVPLNHLVSTPRAPVVSQVNRHGIAFRLYAGDVGEAGELLDSGREGGHLVLLERLHDVLHQLLAGVVVHGHERGANGPADGRDAIDRLDRFLKRTGATRR